MTAKIYSMIKDKAPIGFPGFERYSSNIYPNKIIYAEHCY